MKSRYEYYSKFKNFLCFIKVDENCNLRCSFCYQGDKKQLCMDTQEKLDNCLFNLDYGIKRFLEIRKQERYEHAILGICFFGGEPTLNPWAIKKICKHLKENYPEEVRKNFNITITSNGIIYSEEIIRAIADCSPNPVGIMISSDNSKEVYDKNRKLVGSDKSGFEIVQENIKKYKELLEEINGWESDNFVTVATVLADVEQLKNNPLHIQENYKNITRRGKLLYNLHKQESDYIEEAKNFLFKAYSNLIENCTLENKNSSIGEVLDGVFELKNDREFSECNSIFSIDANGDVNWCNKHRHFENEILPQEKMREVAIFNKNTDNTHFQCVKDKLESGATVKDTIRPQLWQKMIERFDPNVLIEWCNIYSDDLENIYKWIKYMIIPSDNLFFGSKKVYLKFKNEKIEKICKENHIEISNKPLESLNNVFYINEEGNVYFDKIIPREFYLTNIKEKHFMWIYTPHILHSINYFYGGQYAKNN